MKLVKIIILPILISLLFFAIPTDTKAQGYIECTETANCFEGVHSRFCDPGYGPPSYCNQQGQDCCAEYVRLYGSCPLRIDCVATQTLPTNTPAPTSSPYVTCDSPSFCYPSAWGCSSANAVSVGKCNSTTDCCQPNCQPQYGCYPYGCPGGTVEGYYCENNLNCCTASGQITPSQAPTKTPTPVPTTAFTPSPESCGTYSIWSCTNRTVDYGACDRMCRDKGFLSYAGCTAWSDISGYRLCLCDDGVTTGGVLLRTDRYPDGQPPEGCYDGSNRLIWPYVNCGQAGSQQVCCKSEDLCSTKVDVGECNVLDPSGCHVDNGGPCDPEGNSEHDYLLCVIDDQTGLTKCICTDDELLRYTGGVKQKIFCDDRGNPTHDPSSGKLYTAIGCIPVENQVELVRFILRWAMGIAGGIALLLIVYAGFLITTSQGIPQRLQAGKELLTATLAGVVLILFSVYILYFIGYDILGISSFE
jgi:hypothetical protein